MPEPDLAHTTARSLAGRKAAHVSWSRTSDPAARTAAGSAAFLARFERQVDPDGTMDSAERERRAGHLRSAYFAGLQLKSMESRRKAALLLAEAQSAEEALAAQQTAELDAQSGGAA